ncbi:MAG: NfeD family protein [Clostridia bacterium]|nr:NfeD family protein [Clostridia bacterium]
MISNEMFWLAAVVIFAVAEATTQGLVSIWFAGGALAGLIAAMLGASITVQTVIFIAVSAILILALRKIAVKSFRNPKSHTNLDRIVGQKVIISEEVDLLKKTGKVTINDVEWKVKSEDGEVIPEGDAVTVTAIEGVKLVVKR